MPDTSNQAILRRSITISATFTVKPDEATRKALIAAGFQFDGKSAQWYRVEREAHNLEEKEVVTLIREA